MLTLQEAEGFFINPEQLDLEKYVLADYFFECTVEPRLAAANLACEQSTVQWKRPGVKEDFRKIHGAFVLNLEVVGESSKPLYPEAARISDRYSRCRARVAHPHINFGPRLANLLTALAGEGPFYCPGITTIKLMNLEFPNTYLKNFAGPQFGLAGLRQSLGVKGRPFFIGVVKPNLGLPVGDFAQRAYEAWLGGLDIDKDDEMLADQEPSPLDRRAKQCGHRRQAAEKETGDKKMMIMNISGEADELLANYQKVAASGSNAVMINPFTMGISAVGSLRKISKLPIMGHFAGEAISSRMQYFGVHTVVWTKLLRLAGCDMIGLSGFGERMHNTDEEVLANVAACLAPMGQISTSLPIPGGSDWAGSLPRVYEKIGHVDFGFISGRGVFNHPLGVSAGAKSLQQAWEAVQQGISLEVAAKDKVELKAALDFFK